LTPGAFFFVVGTALQIMALFHGVSAMVVGMCILLYGAAIACLGVR
jgi:hypothetical protein